MRFHSVEFNEIQFYLVFKQKFILACLKNWHASATLKHMIHEEVHTKSKIVQVQKIISDAPVHRFQAFLYQTTFASPTEDVLQIS